MKKLLSIVLPLALSGCWSQVFLDSMPGNDKTHVAGNAATGKKIYALSSSACEGLPAPTRYQIREYSDSKWIQRCARIEGFHYRTGNDYLLEVKEDWSGDSGLRLVLERVLAEWPQARGR